MCVLSGFSVQPNITLFSELANISAFSEQSKTSVYYELPNISSFFQQPNISILSIFSEQPNTSVFFLQPNISVLRVFSEQPNTSLFSVQLNTSAFSVQPDISAESVFSRLVLWTLSCLQSRTEKLFMHSAKPRKRFMENLKENLKVLSMNVKGWEELTMNRADLRHTLGERCNTFDIERLKHDQIKNDLRFRFALFYLMAQQPLMDIQCQILTMKVW